MQSSDHMAGAEHSDHTGRPQGHNSGMIFRGFWICFSATISIVYVTLLTSNMLAPSYGSKEKDLKYQILNAITSKTSNNQQFWAQYTLKLLTIINT